MGLYRLEIRPAATEHIRRLPPELKRAVKAAIRALAEAPTAGDPLHGELAGMFKVRVRRYRIVYAVDRTARILNILAVGHRRSIYEEFAETTRGRAED
ncbi:MAG TPA: type II toxin-antitoxin system RelE/ParE family toxin [Burkholderiales bacterium]|nr:type II toxin-antitoxin system RelE/ParE family toxin [Burkholderiales bacterium]